MTEWGKEIEVNGVRPAWLADDMWDKVVARLDYGAIQHPSAATMRNIDEWTWDTIVTLRLPADHFAYLAIERGFEPWGGQSRTAPADWDEGDVLRRGGYAERRHPWIAGFYCNERWHWLDQFFAGNDIVGYRKKVAPPREETTLDEVLCRLTDGAFYDDHDWASGPALRAVKRAIHAEREAEQQAKGSTVTLARMTESEAGYHRDLLGHLRRLGLIMPDPTPLDRFMDAHPDADRATAEKAIAWSAAA